MRYRNRHTIADAADASALEVLRSYRDGQSQLNVNIHECTHSNHGRSTGTATLSGALAVAGFGCSKYLQLVHICRSRTSFMLRVFNVFL